ncbi:MAG: heavy-metal-associated domain-containing protein [Erysipelotrichaceae bacterium]|nr:heavy-metal-associated domain-containing protein [Erysipelotrichaceae bacterium]
MTKYLFKVDGMYCSMCENHINDTIRNNAQVKSVKSDHKKGNVEVIAENLDINSISGALSTLGYTIDLLEESPYEKKKFSLFGKQ